jgi:hypothetical protein
MGRTFPLAMPSFRLFSAARAAALLAVFAAARHAPAAETFTGVLSLVRYDLPIGNSDGYAPTRQLAARKTKGADAVDWPDFTLDGRPLFRERAEETVQLTLHSRGEAASSFQSRADDVIQPGNHWLRAMDWRQGRRHIYTADNTARTAESAESMTGRYELWTFPVRIHGEGAPVVKNVVLQSGGSVIYQKDGPWRSLTLLLPAGAYELILDGRPPLAFSTGFLPVKLGSPREVEIVTDQEVPGGGAKIRIQSLRRPEEFPNPEAWEADVAALGKVPAAPPLPPREKGLARWLGSEISVSPLTLYAMQLPHGMSGGFYKQGAAGFNGPYADYVAHLAGLGLDAVFDQANALPAPDDPESFEMRAAALAARGLKLGLQYDNNWSRPALQHPNVAFFSHTLPEWHAPLYRSLSLAAQRFSQLPNFLGFSIGSDNAGYVSHWHWAPPIPDRPWGEAMINYLGTPEPGAPRAPSLGPRELPFEYPVNSTAEFIKYVGRYDVSFEQYGYFAEAVRDVNPGLVFTTGSFGSSPGAGGRGGWPWASLPGRPMFEGLNVQQAYDWNELHAALPLHNVALLDRLRSYWPQKRTWALLDNFKFLYGREAWQRACALVLTRGLQGLGTNFLPKADGDGARADAVAYETEMNAWMRRYGAVYARTEPQPVIGIFYGQHQAVQRRVLSGVNPPDDAVYAGSHEGKVTEALFFCHAAGLPARVITYQEVMRGPLPVSIKAILLVGLEQADPSWNWAPGLDRPLSQFVEQGGRIIADDDSFSPVACVRPGLRVAAYQPESDLDPTPLLLGRNRENIRKLREVLRDLPALVAASDDPSIWAIPTVCGDTQYVTVVNQGVAEGDEAKEMLRPPDPKASRAEVWKTKANASLYVQPQIGAVAWNTRRPIYDLRLGRRIEAAEAARVDLTKDAFQWYALPPAEVTAPALVVTKDFSGFYQALVTIGGAEPMSGIPVQIVVSSENGSATISAVSGFPARLPINERDSGEYRVVATELLSGLTASASVRVPPYSPEPSSRGAVTIHDSSVVSKFAERKHVALTIALTPAQAGDPQIVEQSHVLEEFYRQRGRIVSRGSVRPGGIVESLQPLASPNRFPQWKTIASDLVLFGSAADNVLLLDQMRAQIFPADLRPLAPGAAEIVPTRSPFVGEYDALNILAGDAAGIRAAVEALVSDKTVTQNANGKFKGGD